MCKISGVIFDADTHNKTDLVLHHNTRLIEHTEGVNTHATGVAVVSTQGDVHVYKNSKTASKFVQDIEYKKFIVNNVNDDTFAVINHCRYATQGSNLINANNHPIVDGPIVGVHNGVISNDDILGKKYGRVAEVDSAVIFSILKSTPNNKTSLEDIKTTMDLLEGSATVVLVDKRNFADEPQLFIAKKNNPMNFIKLDSCLWFASTSQILSSFIREPIVRGTRDYSDTLDLSIRGMMNHTARVFTNDSDKADWWLHSKKIELTEPQRFKMATTYQSKKDDDWVKVYRNDDDYDYNWGDYQYMLQEELLDE